MTYSRPSTGQVDAYGEVGSPMAITRDGLRSKSTISAKGAYLDNRDPAQAGRNETAKTAGVENFLKFLVDDIAPIAKGELQAQGNAAAMKAVTSIPGMSDGSFYRQSDPEQQKILKDYNLNGYALDQFKSYGAGVAVGQYGSDISDRMLSSPILQSDAPQAERDAEKQRIFSESRTILQGIEPGYLSKYAPQLSNLEGGAVGKTEKLARDARNNNLANAGITAAKTSWEGYASTYSQVVDRDSDESAAALYNGPLADIKESWGKAQSTQTVSEFYAQEEQGMLSAALEAIGDEEGEKALAILSSWEALQGLEYKITPTVNFWDLGNKAGEDGRTTVEKIGALKARANKLLKRTLGDRVIADNGDLVAGALRGEKPATDALMNLVGTMLASGDPGEIEKAKALLEQTSQVVSQGRNLAVEDSGALAELQSLADDPAVSNQEFANRAQQLRDANLISNAAMVRNIERRASPTQLQLQENRAYKELSETVVGGLDREGNFVTGEDGDVNAVIEDAKKILTAESSELVGELEGYLSSTFLSEAKVAVRKEFEDAGKPMPEGADLQQAIKTQAMRLVKQETARIKTRYKGDKQKAKEKISSIKDPIYKAIEDGVSRDKIWGDSIIETAKKTGARPDQVWEARYTSALVGVMGPEGVRFTKETAREEAKKQLEEIRRKLRAQYKPSAGSKGIPTRVPEKIEISYDTAMPGMQEEIAAASKNPDQEGEGSVLVVGGTKVLNALGRVLPGGGSPAAAATASSELSKAQSIQAIQNSDGWKSLNRMFARRERVSSTSPPLPQLPPTALTDTVPIAMTSDRHPMMVHIGIAEGTRTINGGYTRAYKGHTDPGDGHRNRGTFSGGRGMGNATPQQVDRHWMRELTARSARVAPVVARAGLRPGTVGYNRFMFNYLDLAVQAPRAADSFAAKLSSMKAGNWSIEVMAKARADSFYNPMTGRLEASGFGNNYSRLLGDQRSRAGVWDYKRRI